MIIIGLCDRPLEGNTGDANIWCVHADGSGAVPLTRLRPTVPFIGSYGVTWSPDGLKLAFISDRALDGSNAQNTNEIRNVWVMNADGSGLKPLTRLTTALTTISSRVVSSPDSRKLARASLRPPSTCCGVD
jgi:Tol biopolymer transport system component